MPVVIINSNASVLEIFNCLIFFLSIINKNPDVGLGVVGTNTLTYFTPSFLILLV